MSLAPLIFEGTIGFLLADRFIEQNIASAHLGSAISPCWKCKPVQHNDWQRTSASVEIARVIVYRLYTRARAAVGKSISSQSFLEESKIKGKYSSESFGSVIDSKGIPSAKGKLGTIIYLLLSTNVSLLWTPCFPQNSTSSSGIDFLECARAASVTQGFRAF